MTLGFIYGFLQFTLTGGLFFFLYQYELIDSMHLLTFRYGGRSCGVSLCLYLKLAMQNGFELDYFMETLNFTSNLFWLCLGHVDFE